MTTGKFSAAKFAALTKPYALFHCHGDTTSCGSTVVLDAFLGLVPSDETKLPSSNAD
jgi:hypothetical protein